MTTVYHFSLCPKCWASTPTYHDDWWAIACPGCGDTLRHPDVIQEQLDRHPGAPEMWVNDAGLLTLSYERDPTLSEIVGTFVLVPECGEIKAVSGYWLREDVMSAVSAEVGR